MAKKKVKQKNKKNSLSKFGHNRIAFYTLVIIVVLAFTTTIKAFQTAEDNSMAVLGDSSDNRGKRESEQRHEEKKEEIKTEFNVKSEGLKVKFEEKNGTIQRTIEYEQEQDGDILDDNKKEELKDTVQNEFELENETEIASDDGSIVVTKNHVKARTGFPLSIDAATNQLIVTRPDGTTKVVTVLPDQAVENFARHKKITFINTGTGTGSATTTPGDTGGGDNTSTSSASVSLVERNGEIAYEIKGKKKLRFLGIIPVTTSTTGYVSADTGQILGEDQPVFDRILNFFSF